MPRAGRGVGHPRCLRSFRGRGEAELGCAGCQPPPDTAPRPPPPLSAPFSTSSIYRGRERVTHAPRPPSPPLCSFPSSLLPATRARLVPPSPGGFQHNFARRVRPGKRGRSGTFRLPGRTAAKARAFRTHSELPHAWLLGHQGVSWNPKVPRVFWGT